MVQERMTFRQSSRVQLTNRKIARITEGCRISIGLSINSPRQPWGRAETVSPTVIITNHDLNIYEIYLMKRKFLFH